MRKLLGRALLLFALTATIVAALTCLIPADQSSYFAAVIDKHQRLGQSPSPKVVLVGGSNLAFSVDSTALQKELGIPVVNMGLHANLGLRFMLDEVEPILASDIYIIVPEYQHLTGSPIDGTPKDLGAVIEAYPAALRYLRSPRQIANVLVGLVQLQASRLSLARLVRQPVPDPIYTRQGFNSNGDVVSHLGRTSPGWATREFWGSPPIYRGEAASLLNRFSRLAAGRGAKVFLMFPCIPDSVYEANRSVIELLRARLSADLLMPILGSPLDFTFADAYFFDSYYHMSGEGRAARSERMIALLQPMLTPVQSRLQMYGPNTDAQRVREQAVSWRWGSHD